jgi:serine/threonine protein kinase
MLGSQHAVSGDQLAEVGLASTSAEAATPCPGLPGSLLREWLLSNALPPHPNVVRLLRVGLLDLSAAPTAAVASAAGGAELASQVAAALADKAGSAGQQLLTKQGKGLSPTVAAALRALPETSKAALASWLVTSTVASAAASGTADASSSSGETDGSAGVAGAAGAAAPVLPPSLAFAVSECAAGSLQAARAAMATPLPFTALFPLALQLARGLAHAAAYRVAHRDLHPGNVLVFPSAASGSVGGAAALPGGPQSPRYALSDFGSAVRLPGDALLLPYRGPSQAIGGALAYLPPEVLVAAARAAAGSGWTAGAEGSPTGAGAGAAAPAGTGFVIPYGKADVWGLGALLVTIATGAHPWPGELRRTVCHSRAWLQLRCVDLIVCGVLACCLGAL